MKTVFAVKQSSAHGAWGAVHKYMMWRKMSEDANSAGSTDQWIIDELQQHLYFTATADSTQRTEVHFTKVGCVYNSGLFECAEERTHLLTVSKLTARIINGACSAVIIDNGMDTDTKTSNLLL